MTLIDKIYELFQKDITEKDIDRADPRIQINTYILLSNLDSYIKDRFIELQENKPVAKALADLLILKEELSKVMEETYLKWFRITRALPSAEFAQCIAAERFMKKKRNQFPELYAKFSAQF